ncbi:A/G-specific adenine glycosylase [Aliifodinibius sp. S!AR15-10]|uniref:A/G-specific adenine glycosylase n=1 Tax=Aliifodinibius sp. S!AR15-10 TaxID=2950437 RepID=UPI002861530C|nr:A/G-specific adenine glycosylase [Aliifodinibius sp. S!AR15-10]MDR8393189.1 A/G-specific adenine glycosylase [Aliifodinibius sp. S!AR15-10]
MSEHFFSDKLLSWYDQHKRDLPWRDCGDSYKVWVSEIMLQQTRVDQATPYFHRFIERFPTVEDLAEADQQEVLKVWEGLGYYSRARHMHHAAQKVVEDFDGQLPETWDGITSLKGIGPYTASAILSIAFEKPYAVVDGNVIRVISRYFGIEDDVRRTATKNRIQELVDDLIDDERPGDFNQALMELGATVCAPSNPDCENCAVNAECVAYKTVKTDEIPYKSPAKKRPHHQIGVGIIKNKDDQVLIALRPDDAMLGGLWEFPGGKQKDGEEIEETVVRELQEELGVQVEISKPFMKLDHAYSHFKITMHAFLCELQDGTPEPNSSQQVKWISIDELEDYPFPKANRRLTEKLMKLGKGQQQLDL